MAALWKKWRPEGNDEGGYTTQLDGGGLKILLSIWTNTFCQFGQIHFGIWTNTRLDGDSLSESKEEETGG